MKLASSANQNWTVMPRMLSITAGTERRVLRYLMPRSSVKTTSMPFCVYSILHGLLSPDATSWRSTLATSCTKYPATRSPVEMTHMRMPSNESRTMAAIWAEESVFPNLRGHSSTCTLRSLSGVTRMYSLIAFLCTAQSPAYISGERARRTLACIFTCVGVGDMVDSTRTR